MADEADKAPSGWHYDEDTGALVEASLAELPRQWPGVAVLESQLMPDHLHFDLAVREAQKKPLGAIIGSFKSKTTSRWLELSGRLSRTRESARASCAAPPSRAFAPSCAATPSRAAPRAAQSLLV